MDKPQIISINQITLPEIKILSCSENIPQLFKIWFDKIWNVGGKSKSMNYAKNGNWLDFRI